MNKLIKSTTFFLSLMAGTSFSILLGQPYKYYRWFSDPIGTRSEIIDTTLKTLAKAADIIAIGKIIDGELPFTRKTEVRTLQLGYYNVRIEEAFMGCTNGQIIRIYQTDFDQPYLPVINTNFFFVAMTNDFMFTYKEWDVTSQKIEKRGIFEDNYVPDEILPIFMLKNENRSWWYVDDPENSLRIQYLTNAVQHARIEPNWTNVYELCRDNVNSTSTRVKDDAEYELGFIMEYGSTLEQLQMMDNDPLFPAVFKKLLVDEIQKRTP